ncbi:hypothetical protein TNCV_282501 [Trichonephila clavipes]|nr:hypothetical protein TNCV_282501 [Trichonephila clavipes]
MKVHPDSQKLMTINTTRDYMFVKRLMYGLNGAPAIGQRYVDGLFQGMDGVKDQLRRDDFEFRDSKLDVGDRVAVESLQSREVLDEVWYHCKPGWRAPLHH